ncbi:MAG: hypothetical protein MUF04_10260 [Akkermansiaceae bacterium]|nr:hypothetical protein [Akkermansiaceae bacterium]
MGDLERLAVKVEHPDDIAPDTARGIGHQPGVRQAAVEVVHGPGGAVVGRHGALEDGDAFIRQ